MPIINRFYYDEVIELTSKSTSTDDSNYSNMSERIDDGKSLPKKAYGTDQRPPDPIVELMVGISGKQMNPDSKHSVEKPTVGTSPKNATKTVSDPIVDLMVGITSKQSPAFQTIPDTEPLTVETLAKKSTKTDRPSDPIVDLMVALTSKQSPAFHTIPDSKDDDDDEDDDDEDDTQSAANIDGRPSFAVDHKSWDSLDISSELKEMFQYVLRYSPSKVPINYVLQPFIPEFIPAVGDIDAFLKVVPPVLNNDRRGVAEFIAKLGIDTLDEPAGQQSEPALLHMRLRSVSTTHAAGGRHEAGAGGVGSSATGGGTMVPIARQPKDIDKWMHEIQQLHVIHRQPLALQQQQQLQQQRRCAQPDVDALMNEWPTEMERVLGGMGFPSAYLDCTLEMYVRLCCGLLDIPLPVEAKQADYICALSTLFNLYMAVKQAGPL